MMLHVADVIQRYGAERERPLPANPAMNAPFCLWDVTDHVREMAIVRGPQFDEIRPRAITVALRFDPEVLRIAGKTQITLGLHANEPLMVVRRGVDQVTEDLLR